MKLVFYSLILNNHQANVADELWELTQHQFCFVELANLQAEHRKGDIRNYNDCPYLLRAWETQDSYAKAMRLAQTAECCVFSSVQALPFQKERMRLEKLSFDMSERWLKRGIKNLFSPAIFRMFLAYKLGGWNNKPLYKLCCSAFAKGDHEQLGMYKDKCYKWGYFTNIEEKIVEASQGVSTSSITQLMWCSRYLMLKHPELPILLAERLKSKGYSFHLDMYGEGEYKSKAIELANELGLQGEISFFSNKPNSELMEDMRKHDIFLFTSDRNEGWGAVANESMSNGCALVISKDVGSAPYLIQDGTNGCLFDAPSSISSFSHPDADALDSLCQKVEFLLNNPRKLSVIRQYAVSTMHDQWSPKCAASNLLELISDLQNGKDTSIDKGPCSKA